MPPPSVRRRPCRRRVTPTLVGAAATVAVARAAAFDAAAAAAVALAALATLAALALTFAAWWFAPFYSSASPSSACWTASAPQQSRPGWAALPTAERTGSVVTQMISALTIAPR
eukprot:scaffold92618_cov60-Phaeocystis_antarctica.AAC.1